MFKLSTVFPVTMAALLTVAWTTAAQAENWKRGRIYYRMVCTECHTEQAGKSISPSQMTMAEWKSYLEADKHAASGKANPSVRYYVSKEFRASVQDTNKAAAKLIDVPDEELYADLRAFVIKGAKDGDQPARCQ